MKTHPLNVSYLVVGLAFLGIAGSWALHEGEVIGADTIDLLLPLTLVIAGGIGLVAFVAKSLRRDRTDAAEVAAGTSYDDRLTYDDDTTLIETDPSSGEGETR